MNNDDTESGQIQKRRKRMNAVKWLKFGILLMLAIGFWGAPELVPEVQAQSGWEWPAEGGSEPVEQSEGRPVRAWLPYVLMGVLVFVLIIIFAILLVVLMISSKNRNARQEEQLRQSEQERNNLQDQMMQVQRQLEDMRSNPPEPLNEEPIQDPHANKTIVYGRAKLGLVLIDRTTGVTYPLALHKANPDGHVTDTPQYKLGRDKDCDIVLPEDSISSHHCDVYANYDGDVFVFDHKSTNGTLILREEKEIIVKGEEALQNQDILVLGDRRVGAAQLRVIIETFS
jgi:type II secretory pathway pseudopilin PulG